ncbi:MANSC domain-containing protein 1-like isoform X3 [Patiria miniata]|uniref:MANSC domain-containing protein n=1 Tax=Patiria miniata TaxID=46514 RepID=A0A913ZCJ0_PATMI|nr:MANSC domain-containing protein 1-like isoform X3 [Patiria miniata]
MSVFFGTIDVSHCSFYTASSVMHLQMFIRAAILVTLVALAASLDCSYDDQEGYIIDIHNSEKNGAIFMSDVNTVTRESCQNACCDAEEVTLEDGSIAWCNLAVYHDKSRDRKSKNCFLVFCPSENSCRLTKVKGFTSSYVTEKTTRSSTLLPENESTLSPSTKQSTPIPDSTSPFKTTPSIPASISMDNQSSSSILFNETNISDDLATDVDSEDGQDSSEYSVNASNGALIAAVCFGVIFLLAVMVVLGKHWYEAYQRRHYSKVDYLINGMYN